MKFSVNTTVYSKRIKISNNYSRKRNFANFISRFVRWLVLRSWGASGPANRPCPVRMHVPTSGIYRGVPTNVTSFTPRVHLYSRASHSGTDVHVLLAICIPEILLSGRHTRAYNACVRIHMHYMHVSERTCPRNETTMSGRLSAGKSSPGCEWEDSRGTNLSSTFTRSYVPKPELNPDAFSSAATVCITLTRDVYTQTRV